MSAKSTTTTSLDGSRSERPSQIRIVQNFILIWLDSNINESDVEFKNSLTQLRRIVNTIDIFTDTDQCVDFLTDIKDEKIFMIVSDVFSQQLVPLIQEIPQLYSIYIFCKNKSQHEQWTKEWTKVKGVFTQIGSICNILKQDAQQCDHDDISINFTSGDLNRLDPSFMYTQLLKETLLEIEYDDKVKKALADYCRNLYNQNNNQLQIIDEFEREYHLHTPIWWYTRECFTYQMLNRALRTQEVEIIINMGFFLRDVHQQIEDLHSQTEYHGLFIVYRGQGMSNVDFEKIRNNNGGLLAFNNFLSTTKDQNVSLRFARKALRNPESVGILFQMTINPSISSAIFAPLDNVSYYKASEKEILFSMHTVFRIGQIKQIEDRFWQVKLALASDDDDGELKRLTEHMRQETQGVTGWHRLGELLMQMGNFDKAEEVYTILLRETSENDHKGLSHLYNQLGLIKDRSWNCREALVFYKKALEIYLKFLSPYHPTVATIYHNIGLVLENIEEYSKALELYQKSLEIKQESLPPNHPSLAQTYNNIASVHEKMEEHWKALKFYQKALEIQQKSLPPNHPGLAHTYNNIGKVHDNMGEYSKAREFYQKTLQIQQKSLSPNHPDCAQTYNNIGKVHYKMGEYPKANEFYQKALGIYQKCLPPNHPDLTEIYTNISKAHGKMGDYSKTLSSSEQTLKIVQHLLPPNDPLLQLLQKKLAELRKIL